MSATTIVSDTMVVPAPETAPPPPPTTAPPSLMLTQKTHEVEFAKCDCCELTEECTQAYIDRIRERYLGKWICGLCAEAIKDEIIRTDHQRLIITTEEAMANHMSFCKKFRSSSGGGPPPDATIHLISAMRQLLRRSLDSPRGLRSTPTSPTNKVVGEIRHRGGPGLTRAESCFPTLSG
ncbi:hypothetical protein ACOSQ3_020255 [Xanthoceras sorbifolium]